MLTEINQGSIVIMRTWLNLGIAGLWLVQLMPGASEKDINWILNNHTQNQHKIYKRVNLAYPYGTYELSL